MKVPISLIERLEDIKMQGDLIEKEFGNAETNKAYSDKLKTIELVITDKRSLGNILLRVILEDLRLNLEPATPLVIEDYVL